MRPEPEEVAPSKHKNAITKSEQESYERYDSEPNAQYGFCSIRHVLPSFPIRFTSRSIATSDDELQMNYGDWNIST